MSPVSRGRKPKKAKKRAGGKRRAVPGALPFQPGQLDRAPSWFAPAIKTVIDGAESLRSADGPRALERMTGELLGAELHQVLHGDRPTGLRFGQWFGELVDAVGARVREGAGVSAHLLLRGLTLIGPSQQARHASSTSRAVRELLPADARLPGWLDDLAGATATGELSRMVDAYGTRMGILAGYRYGKDHFAYLFDIDAAAHVRLVGAGDFNDAAQAAEAWRGMVGASAVGVRAVTVAGPSELGCLAECDLRDELIMGDENRVVLDNWFRASRRIEELLEDAPARGSLFEGIDTEPMVAEFSTWYEQRHGARPDSAAVADLAAEWCEGSLPETWFRVSPGQLETMRSLIGDWGLDDPATIEVLDLLPDWATWLSERNGLPAPLRERVLSVARQPRSIR